MKKLLLGLSLSCGIFWAGTADVLAKPARERNYESVRSYGRGGTFVAAQPSDESVFMNPATLGEKHDVSFQIRWLQLDGLWGKNTQDTISQIAELEPGSVSPVTILQDFSDKFGKQQYLRFQGTFGIRILNLDIAPFFRTSNWLDMRVPTTPEIDLNSDTMAGANISFGMGIGKDLYLGGTVRPFFRNLFTTDLTFVEILEFEPLGEQSPEDVFVNENGSGVGFDLGAIYYVGKETRLGMTVEDIGYTSYVFSSNDDTPKPIPTYMSLGMQTRYDFKPWRLDWSLDFRDVLNPEGIHMLRMLHTGLEFATNYRTLDNDLGVMAGLNEGYLTFGAFVDMYIARLDIVSYAVELGEVPGQRQDRRIGLTARSSLVF